MEKIEPIMHGNATEEVKKEILEEEEKIKERGYSADLSDEEVIELIKLEIIKTPIDIEVINLANKFVKELLADFNIEGIDLKENRVHILPEDIYKKVVDPEFANNEGCYSSEHKAMFIKSGEGEMIVTNRIVTILHELIHSNEFRAEQVFEFKDGKDHILSYGSYRGGIRTFPNLKSIEESGDSFKGKFIGLNEAVVVEIEKILLAKIIFESKYISKELFTDLEVKKDIAEHFNLPIEEIQLVAEDGMAQVGYYEQRQTLHYIIDSIIEDGDVRSKKEIIDIFIKAHFTGNLLEIARLIEKSFGIGSFRLLSNMNATPESADEIKSLLKIKREDFLKNK